MKACWGSRMPMAHRAWTSFDTQPLPAFPQLSVMFLSHVSESYWVILILKKHMLLKTNKIKQNHRTSEITWNHMKYHEITWHQALAIWSSSPVSPKHVSPWHDLGVVAQLVGGELQGFAVPAHGRGHEEPVVSQLVGGVAQGQAILGFTHVFLLVLLQQKKKLRSFWRFFFWCFSDVFWNDLMLSEMICDFSPIFLKMCFVLPKTPNAHAKHPVWLLSWPLHGCWCTLPGPTPTSTSSFQSPFPSERRSCLGTKGQKNWGEVGRTRVAFVYTNYPCVTMCNVYTLWHSCTYTKRCKKKTRTPSDSRIQVSLSLSLPDCITSHRMRTKQHGYTRLISAQKSVKKVLKHNHTANLAFPPLSFDCLDTWCCFGHFLLFHRRRSFGHALFLQTGRRFGHALLVGTCSGDWTGQLAEMNRRSFTLHLPALIFQHLTTLRI